MRRKAKQGQSERVFLTVKEAAAIVRVRPTQIYRWISEGKFPSVKVGGRVLVPARYLQDLEARALEDWRL